MRGLYVDPEHWATISLMELRSEEAWLITGVEVNKRFRGHGYASDLLGRVCEDADHEGVTLVLDVSPDGTGLSETLLHKFYSSHGFKPWSEAETGMIRHPRSAT